MLAKTIYSSFILAGVAMLAFAVINEPANKSFLMRFGTVWLALSILGSFLDARFGHRNSNAS